MLTNAIKLISHSLIVMSVIFFFACDGKKTSDDESTTTDSTAVENEEATTMDEETSIASPRKKAEGTIGEVNVVVDYGSPAVKDREIWGGLEEYGVVWRAGANEVTAVSFSDDVLIGGQTVPAGTYGLYIIPNEAADWTMILNTDWDREKHGAWGAYNYNVKNDVVRVDVSPQWVEENKERLEYMVVEDGIGFAWEKARLTLPVEKAEGSN